MSETKVLLEDGITVGGKPIRDYYEATGHGKAYDYMLSLAKDQDKLISEERILEIHRLIYALVDEENAGVYRKSVFLLPEPSICRPHQKKYLQQ